MDWGRKVEEVVIPPYQGRSVQVKRGQHLVLVDVDGKQVGDFVCFNAHDVAEWVSPVHMRASLASIRLKVGDYLYSNRRRPLMKLVRDTVGVHDFFFPACDYWRYKVDFGLEDHPNCHDNLMKALDGVVPVATLPDPINWFMNNRMNGDGDYVISEPLSKPGDYVELEALDDLVVAIATCSQDLAPVNGMKVTRLRMEIFDPPSR
ncbi:MAG: aminomethyltransferase [Sulfobacillus benefaciens]|uniref:Aminomethyltransferase n=1 Tax=Sulfobacillus benefaciens TaxID=453960 RepID=A0A2T2X8W4_9FIRM|nr:MAG: aminomethyltransferase [Sulfobacillus benefaciens]